MGDFERAIVDVLSPIYNGLLDNSVCHGYTQFAEATHVFPPLAVEAQMGEISGMVGMPIDVVKFFLSLCLSYPMGFAMRLLPFGTARHLGYFLGGVMMAQFCFGPGWAHLFMSSMITYFLVMFGGKNIAGFNFNIQLGYMIVCHLNRLINHFGEFILDFTGSCQRSVTLTLSVLSSHWIPLFQGLRWWRLSSSPPSGEPSLQTPHKVHCGSLLSPII